MAFRVHAKKSSPGNSEVGARFRERLISTLDIDPDPFIRGASRHDSTPSLNEIY